MSDFEKFQQAHARLFSLVTDPEGKRFSIPKTSEQRQADMQEAMVRTADFLTFASNPETRFKGVHVTGTSGKGSVTMMISALLSGMGYRTGMHTSPYLQLPTEKLIVDGKQVGLLEFVALIEQFEKLHADWGAAEGAFTRLRYTEAWTAITFLWLAGAKLDWGVVETGMGGRLDPTNLMPSKLAVITNVAYDHIKSLGPELTDIARHKAGIIKPNRPVITAIKEPALFEIVQKEALEKEATLYRLGDNEAYSFQVLNEETIRITTPIEQYDQIKVGPRGRYQLGNAALAVSAVDAMRQHGMIQREINTEALATLSLPGRMEVVEKRPLTILDGAHNPHKMEALVRSMQLDYPNQRIIAIVGGIVNKEISGILELLMPIASDLIATAPEVPGKPAVPPDHIAATVRGMGVEANRVHVAETIREAVRQAKKMAKRSDIILITGSLYLVGAAREIWHPQ